MIHFLNRLVDRTIGALIDRVFHWWDGSWVRRQRRRLRHRQAVYRSWLRRYRTHPRWGGLVRFLDRSGRAILRGTRSTWRGCGRGGRTLVILSHRARHSRAGVLACQASIASWRYLVRFGHAHADAWRWLAGLVMRPFRGPAEPVPEVLPPPAITDVAPTGATLPDGLLSLITCAACGHEVLGTNMRKYFRYRCPMCKSQLLVIDSQRGVSMEVSSGERQRTVTRVEKAETEESEPLSV